MLFYSPAKWGGGKPSRFGGERLGLISSFEGMAAKVYRPKSGLAGQTENFAGFAQVKLVSRFIGG